VTIEYDSSSKRSIWEAAKTLTGRSLRQATSIEHSDNVSHKGDLGTLVENYFFLINPGNSPEPDFPEAGLELKTTGLLRHAARQWRAKERLVLSMINYEEIVKESWASAGLLKKCSSMLILFYEYIKDQSVIDRKFVLEPKLYELPEEDLPQIKKDWEVIRDKVRAGKAHELSEGDTYYLGACRKGSGAVNEALRVQPFSNIKAKSRAFSFKQGYVDVILQNHIASLASIVEAPGLTIEEATNLKFRDFIGKTMDEIGIVLHLHKSSHMEKGFHRRLAVGMLAGSETQIIELVKAGIELKTIRVDSNWRPREAMSFPGFDFMKIIEEDWEDSKFFERLERKFLFIVYRTDEIGIERLEKVFYWNMPFEDREEARSVWERTKAQVRVDAKNLPKASESRVAHVRPKAKNAADTLPTPQGVSHTKQCFWLNQSYIQDIVRSS